MGLIKSHVAAASLIALTLAACGKAEKKHDSVEPDLEALSAYAVDVNRLQDDFLDQGFVVSRYASGEAEHRGDALIWSGIALGVLPCDEGDDIENALISMVERLDGGLYRHPELADRVSMDGALGFYRGVAQRLRCSGKRDLWASPLKLHYEFSLKHKTGLNAASTAELVPEFTYVRDLLLAEVGLRGKPSADRQRTLETQTAGWALAAKLKRASCFRIHLGLITLQTIESLGGQISEKGRDQFCSATKSLELPTVNHWCGRPGLLDFLHSFKHDEWEYRLQRCTNWESPDGNGLLTPALDRLVGLSEYYGFP